MPRRAGLRGLREPGFSWQFVKTTSRPSPRLALPFRGRPNIKPPSARVPEAPVANSSSHGICFPYSVSSRGAAACVAGIASTRPPTPSGYLNLLTLHRPSASRPCFMPAPLMGFALQSFVPPVQPFAVSSAVPLLTFLRLASTSQATRQQMPEPGGSSQRQAVVRPAKPTPPSGSCSARESATRRRWFRPATARCSPGPSPLQGPPPRVDEHDLRRASPHAVCSPGASA